MVGGVRETVEIQGFYEKMGMRKSVGKESVFGDKVKVEIELVKVIWN